MYDGKQFRYNGERRGNRRKEGNARRESKNAVYETSGGRATEGGPESVRSVGVVEPIRGSRKENIRKNEKKNMKKTW